MRRPLTIALAGAAALAVAAPASAAGPACTITGTPGDDRLRGTPGDDVICARGGDDLLRGRGGDDVLRGGRGADGLGGDAGADRLEGGPGADTLVRDGEDRLVRGRGDDDRAGGELLDDYRVTGRLWFFGMEGQEVTTSEGSPSNCTRDEEQGTFRLDNDNTWHDLGATIKDGGWCAVQPSHNVWNLAFPGGGTGRVELNDKGWEAPYQMHCLKDGWKGYTCTETSTGGGSVKVTIKPS